MFKKKILSNGLRVIAVPLKENQTVTVLVLVEAGSKYETKKQNGISHFLEHMCFKGTAKRPHVSQISYEFDALGSQHNAFTGWEYTGYYVKVHARHFDKVLDLISDLYLNPLFSETEMEKEKGVVVEEINMYEDMQDSQAQQLFARLLYGNQPAGYPILGTKESVGKIKRSDCIEYRNKQYVSTATTVIVAGDIIPSVVFKKVEEKFSEISRGRKHGKKKTLSTQSRPKVAIKYKKIDQAHIVLGVRTFDMYHKDTSTLSVLSAVLGGGMSSYLFNKLRNELGICYYVYTMPMFYTDHGHFEVAAGVTTDRAEEAVLAILEGFRKLQRKPVSLQELKKTKNFITGNMYLNLESSSDIAEYYGFQETLKRKILTPNERARRIQRVTPNDIQRVAKLIFSNDRLNLALVGPFRDTRSFKKLLKI